ncbi:primary-amine oxidase [Nocardioides sp. GY 10127]|uniref:primary-amine oxidase n=1 Tax=Nocardioides sp. GY 10127 TaxID=2569762 RepID=UPI0010A754FC|nr:primary-amine oxidase [Nocardioides sp. GY 10127]TIC79122.1 primary-amine oxidase [Nocardioides sp. GY 10127]
MTLTDPDTATTAPAGGGSSPLSSLSVQELNAGVAILGEAGLAGPDVRFAYTGLLEPAKAEVLAFLDGSGPRPARLMRAQLLNMSTGESLDVVVDLTAGEVASSTVVTPDQGRLPILFEEFAMMDEVCQQDPRWVAAMERRGIDPKDVLITALSAGDYPLEGEEGRRMMRGLGLHRRTEGGQPWAHPIDGVCAYVDTIAREVVTVVDNEVMEVPAEGSTFMNEEGRPAPMEGLKPIEITQPEGPSFTVEGDEVSWANWSFSLGFDAREGLVLHRLAYADPDHGGEVRPVVYRASVAEMVVPYGDPSPVRFWQNYFDTGEYLFGRMSNSLTLGCDCLGEIRYFDATVADASGTPVVIPNAICMHEEDFGTLWKHTDFAEGSEVRRQRRLVISFFTTIGNYDYGFYWYLYLDGKIELEAKLTGILFPAAYKDYGDTPHMTEVAPGLGAPVHQHLFSARLDMMVDGLANAVDEVDAVRLPVSDSNPWGNAFTYRATRLASEAEGAREADASVGRTWHVVSTERTNRLGRPTGYALRTNQQPTLLADPSSSIAARAAFTQKAAWFTAYSPEERYPTGEFVNQSKPGAGLPTYMAADRNLDGADVVLWHTFGVTHFPRTEDWPVMPVDHIGFELVPYGFFDRNPTLNVPASTAVSCHPGGGSSCHGED